MATIIIQFITDILFSVPEKLIFFGDTPIVVVDAEALIQKNDSWWESRHMLKKISNENWRLCGLFPRKFIILL